MCDINSDDRKKYRIVVISDTHHDVARLERLLPVINGTDRLVFCGDGVSDIMRIRGRITVPIVCVKGNNDFCFNMQINDIATVAFGSTRAFVTHGHRYGVRQGLAQLLELSILNDYKLVFFGHTHAYTDVTHSGVRFINPGALCNGSYAIVEGSGLHFVSKNCVID